VGSRYLNSSLISDIITFPVLYSGMVAVCVFIRDAMNSLNIL
jgi:hypothetical protein